MMTLETFSFPNYWERQREKIESIDQLLSRFDEIQKSYQADEDEAMSVYLINQE
jgi:hypothetical protein